MSLIGPSRSSYQVDVAATPIHSQWGNEHLPALQFGQLILSLT